MRRHRPLVAVALAAAAVSPACGSSAGEEMADLCRDLRSLRATFELLLAPPADATVGEVRGALEKVAPFLSRVSANDATEEALDDAIDDVVESFREGLDGLGDDEPAHLADRSLAGARPRMADAVEASEDALDCQARNGLGGTLPAEQRATV